VFSDGRNRNTYALNDDAGILDDIRKLKISPEEPVFIYLHLYSAHNLGLRHHPAFNRSPLLFGNILKQPQLLEEITFFPRSIVQYPNKLVCSTA